MYESFDPSSAPPAVQVPHEGQLFLQRLSGRLTSPPAREPAPQAEPLDLAELVRRIGEW